MAKNGLVRAIGLSIFTSSAILMNVDMIELTELRKDYLIENRDKITNIQDSYNYAQENSSFNQVTGLGPNERTLGYFIVMSLGSYIAFANREYKDNSKD